MTFKGGFKPFDVPRPASAAAWDRRRAGLRARLAALLGDLPPLFTPSARVLARTDRGGWTLEKIAFDNGVGDGVRGYLCLPKGPRRRRPAVLYHHYHGMEYGNGKEELLKRGPAGISPAEAFAREGWIALAIDAYAFGERRTQGPAGDRESGIETEHSLCKKFTWEGRTLWGMMVRDDRLALNYLASRPDVDPARIGATGMSMGSTRTWWLAALDERVKVSAAVACLTRYQELIRRGALDQHGFYYFVPGVLKEKIDAEAIVGLVAPRPLLTLTGGRDAGSPVEGVRKINTFVSGLYRLYGAKERFQGVVYPRVGHVYTRAMWDEMSAWFQKYL